MDWDDLRVFLGVARAGSLSGAAPRLRMDPATLGRRIARLEAAAETTLFVKTPQGYALTGAGARLQGHAEAMENAARAGRSDLNTTGDLLSGTLRIGAPDGVANYVLPSVATAIMAAHPNLEVQILALPRVFNLSRREADLAIAVTPPSAGRILVQKLCDYHLSLAADPGYLAAAPPLKSVADLSAHRLIGYIPDMIFDAELDFLSELGVAPTATSNSAAVQLNLIQSGAGIGVIHDFARPAAPSLARVLPQVRFRRSFHLLRPQDEAGQARSQALAQLVMRQMRAEVVRLEATHLDTEPPARSG